MICKSYNRIAATLALLASVSIQGSAQITSFNLEGYVYSQAFCTTPAPAGFIITGSAEGTPPANDSLTVHINFNDGYDTTFQYSPYSGGGNLDSFIIYGAHTYEVPGTYMPSYSVTALASVTDSGTMNSIVVTDTCGNLTGTAYVDADGDCQYDAGETLLNGYVTATNTTTGMEYWGYSNNGVYAINVPGGTYTVAVAGSFWWSTFAPACPVGGTATVSVTGDVTQDFGFSCSVVNMDLSVGALANNFRPGLTRWLSLAGFSNSSCNPVPATITLILDPLLSYSSTDYGPDPTVSGNTLTWNVASLDAMDGFSNWMNIYCDSSATIGDSACLTITISTASTETDTANNTYHFCVPITNSTDPNDKGVSPRGMGSEGYIDAQTEGLTYLVNFQNTGNDVAYDVTIADELDSDIDPASIYVVGASHAYTTNIVNGNELKFRFSGINLPDSNSNEPGSHGWVMYRARIKDDSQQPGTVINNTARIYFDYNPAIVTNTTTNTLITNMGVQLMSQGNLEATVVPNPADGALTVSVKDGKAATAILLDMTGRVVAQQEGAAGRMELATKALPAGMYLLQVRSGHALLSTRVSVQH